MVEPKPRSEPKIAERVEALLEQMTVAEKVSMLSGKNSWQTVPIERLGIPSLTMTDGPHGVRANRTGPERISGTATSFPTGVSMAASWDPELIERVGVALAQETRALGCDILLGPCVNIMRTPLAGRNFEAYSEDPHLAGRIGVAWVKGLQSQRVGASLKHYACNNQETERHRGDSIVDERTLREIYLAQFEAVVKEAQPWTVMCAYNRINGVYASQHDRLLNQILRDEWGFRGVVVSDWGANHTTVDSVAGGLDLEMPGPARWYGSLLEEAVRLWQIDEEKIDDAVRRTLRMIIISGKMDPDPGLPEGALDTPEHRALARELAEGSITLLKNERSVLPLVNVKSLAVIGPNAAEARIGGGGSSYLEPPYRVSPLEGLRAMLGDDVTLKYAQGCANYAELPALKPNIPAPKGDQNGFWGTFFNNEAFEGAPVAERLDLYLDHWRLHLPAGIESDGFSARWEGAFRPSETGRHSFRLRNSGTARLYVNEELVAEAIPAQDSAEPAASTASAHVDLEAGSVCEVRLEYVKPAGTRMRELRLLAAYDPKPEDDDRIEKAAQLAKESDAAIIFGGMPQGFESEGHDRPHMKLPGRQDELIRAVTAANPRTIVVLNVGSPVEMPWVEIVPAVLVAYYPGQEAGSALANILTGEVNPSGKLSVTFPRRYADNPTAINFPGARQVHYGEGIFVGYRYYETKEIDPLFAFGHGLSYTSFSYSDLSVPEQVVAPDGFEVLVTLTNTGAVAGKEVVQLYISDKASSLARPVKELKGFEKVELSPGETRTIAFSLTARDLSYYDPQAGDWVAEPGEFEILVGSSSQDIRLAETFVLI